jgi:hypothetical protein
MNGLSSPQATLNVSPVERACFLKWLLSFGDLACYGQGKLTELSQMSDGVCANNILTDVYSNRAFRKMVIVYPRSYEDCQTNLEACMKDIQLFFTHTIDSSINLLDMPDIDRILRLKDEQEIVKLIVLLLCCVVHSDKKETYVKRILAFDTIEKQILMVNIERTLYIDEDDTETAAELQTIYKNWLAQSELLSKENKQLNDKIEVLNKEKNELKLTYETKTQSLQNISKADFQKNEQRFLAEM